MNSRGKGCDFDSQLGCPSVVLVSNFHHDCEISLFLTCVPILFMGFEFTNFSTDGIDASSVERNVAGFKQYGKNNQESIANLFLALLMKVSFYFLFWVNC